MSSASELRVVPFVPAHFDCIELQPAQAYVREYTTREHLAELASCGPAVTIIDGDRPILCCGMREYGPHRGVLWSYISPVPPRQFVRLHRIAERFIEICDRAHLQATCRTGFQAGARWLTLLGFTWSRSIGPYGPAGMPHELFERVH